ncbi:unnamed protein product [marine sediment metagenome]|uniref:Uncharacterized protein n=1 Tax=marine sediment metagenome TaxID=412755 RepID=X1KWM0_9ZZZZ
MNPAIYCLYHNRLADLLYEVREKLANSNEFDYDDWLLLTEMAEKYEDRAETVWEDPGEDIGIENM